MLHLQPFLEENKYIDFSAKNIRDKGKELFQHCKSDIEKIKIAFKFVRDEIPHSFDIGATVITAKASEVLQHRTGICHAKANLLAALLRAQGIPTGMCFQHITIADDESLGYCIHCFNGVYIDNHWIKIDARGNTNGISAKFSLEKPILAFPIRDEYDEYFWNGIYAKPHLETMKMLEQATSTQYIIENIPDCVLEQPDIKEPYCLNKKELSKIEFLFQEWDKAMIWSCLQGHMGTAYADNRENPLSAQMIIGDFCCFAGKPNVELVKNIPLDFPSAIILMVPQNEQWALLIEEIYQEKAEKITRYAIKKEPYVFNVDELNNNIQKLSHEYSLQSIDEEIYHMLKLEEWSKDLCSQFVTYEEYAKKGVGVAVLHKGIPVSGASSYAIYDKGIEIQIDTREDYRRKGLASASASKLILECLKRGLYPSWDAHNKGSVALAEKLGYHLEGEYVAYAVQKDMVFKGALDEYE